MTAAANKLIYLAKRNPKFNHEQFLRRWRQHGALAMQQSFFSGLSRYAQCDAVKPPAGLKTSADYDGVGLCWFRDLKPFPPEEAERMRADELETFSEYVRPFVVMCEESVLKPGRGFVKASVFIVRKPGTAPEAFARHWREVHGPMMLAQESLQPLLAGYIQNRAVVTDRTKGSRMEYDGVAEFHFSSLEHMGRFFTESAKIEALGRDSEQFLDRGRTLFMCTNEVVLYDAAELAA